MEWPEANFARKQSIRWKVEQERTASKRERVGPRCSSFVLCTSLLLARFHVRPRGLAVWRSGGSGELMCVFSFLRDGMTFRDGRALSWVQGVRAAPRLFQCMLHPRSCTKRRTIAPNFLLAACQRPLSDLAHPPRPALPTLSVSAHRLTRQQARARSR